VVRLIIMVLVAKQPLPVKDMQVRQVFPHKIVVVEVVEVQAVRLLLMVVLVAPEFQILLLAPLLLTRAVEVVVITIIRQVRKAKPMVEEVVEIIIMQYQLMVKRV